MTRLLLPLEHHHDSADLGEDALLVRLKKLPRRVQQVFLLNQLSFAAIAQRLDIGAPTVERHMGQVLQAALPVRSASSTAAAQWYVRLQSPDITASARLNVFRPPQAAEYLNESQESSHD